MKRTAWIVVALGVPLLSASQSPSASADDTRRVVRASVPAYPELMYESSTQGRFEVAVTVLPSGEVHNVVVLESAAPYVDGTLRAHVKRWKFEKSAKTTLHRIEFLFRLLPRDSPPEQLGVFFEQPLTVEICWKEHPEHKPQPTRSPR